MLTTLSIDTQNKRIAIEEIISYLDNNRSKKIKDGIYQLLENDKNLEDIVSKEIDNVSKLKLILEELEDKKIENRELNGFSKQSYTLGVYLIASELAIKRGYTRKWRALSKIKELAEKGYFYGESLNNINKYVKKLSRLKLNSNLWGLLDFITDFAYTVMMNGDINSSINVSDVKNIYLIEETLRELITYGKPYKNN